MQQISDVAAGGALAFAILDTIPQPFLVLDEELRVLAATRSFYEVFQETPEAIHGRALFDIGLREWDVPELRRLLKKVLPEHSAVEGLEVERTVPELGRRVLLLSARAIHYQDCAETTILLGCEDITARRAIERENQALHRRTVELLEEQKTLLAEMRHRIANSLQIIASILLLKAREVNSEEIRDELRDAHRRVLSVAELQKHLHQSNGLEQIDVGNYLRTLTAGVTSSMIGRQKIALEVVADAGSLNSSSAVSLGLIVTELLINAIKYAFPGPREDALVRMTFAHDALGWKLSICDNGVGRPCNAIPPSKGGLGTAIVAALAKQLHATLSEESSSNGLKVQIEHSHSNAFTSLQKAA